MQVRGHTRNNSDTVQFFEATKRDALYLLQKELGKLVDTGPPAQRDRLQKEYEGYTDLFRCYVAEHSDPSGWLLWTTFVLVVMIFYKKAKR